MIDPRFVLLGALLSLVGSTRYAWLTVAGRTRPNRVTWILWATAPLVGFLAQLDEGVGWPAVLTLSIGLGPAVIAAATFVNPAAYWRVGRVDLACGLVSVLALGVWLTRDDPVGAVVLAVLADAVAGVPTIRKAWTHPWTENPVVFVLGAVNGYVTLLTIDRWDVAVWAFPAYLAVLGTGVGLVVVLRQRRLPPPVTPPAGADGPGQAGGATSTSAP
ncbi:hypothetical protein [Phycicoccus flavus]|uniref:hypothetical protein n=1 Tax=Phycicoccus flavus TaxID=2502783 RepID=UPI000FEB8574|nr:hypothetical protein [Phycicoccus flavus]NHA66521.1 hypothetical protein [Phycicoccus flavus]